MDTPTASSEQGSNANAARERWRAAPEGWQDGLTELPGPLFWRAILAAESARHLRYRRPVTLVLAEVSGLDALADDWGDDVASQVVIASGRVFRGGCRTSDYVVRLGGTRFGMLLTETDEVAAINFVERVRERCERQLRGAEERLEVAFGWASPTASETLLVAAERAEARLRREQDREAGTRRPG